MPSLKAPLFSSRKSAQDVREGGAGAAGAGTEKDAIKRRASNGSTTAGVDADGAPKSRPSFGFGLTSFTHSVSKAGDKVSSLARKPAQGLANGGDAHAHPHAGPGGSGPSSANNSPPQHAVGGGAPAGAGSGSMAPPANPDPQLLATYSLKLADLVNKVFLPCAPGAASMASAMSVSGTVAGAAKAIGVSGAADKVGGSGGAGATAAAQRDSIGIPTLAVIAYDGKKLPDKARVQELAQNVTQQLRYAASVDSYLLRAVARQVLKALTLFATRIDSLLVPASKDPNVLKIPTTPKEGRVLPAAMEFNIGLVAIEWIVEDALERCLEGDGEGEAATEPMPRFVREILTPVRVKMESTILHVVQPILSGAKLSIKECIQKAVPQPFAPPASAAAWANGVPSDQRTPGSPSVAAAHEGSMTPFRSLVSPGDASPSARSAEGASSSSAAAWAKELDGRLAGCRRLLVARIENRTSKDGEGWFISVAIYVIWKALFILSARNAEATFMCSTLCSKGSLLQHAGNGGISSVASPGTGSANAGSWLSSGDARRNPSPAQLSSALKAVALTGKAKQVPLQVQIQPGTPTPQSQGQPSVRADASVDLALSRTNSGRATPDCWQPVPDGGFYRCRKAAQVVHDLTTFERLVKEFCSGFYDEPVRRSALGSHVVTAAPHGKDGEEHEEEDDDSSDDESEEDELARAALAEALQALKSIIICLQVLELNPEAIPLALRPKGHALKEAAAAPGENGQQPPHSLPAETVRAFRAAPPIILLHIIWNRLPASSGRIAIPSPPEVFGLSWPEYEKSIPGFVGGHTWADALLAEWKPLVEAAWKSLAQHLAEAEQKAQELDQPQSPPQPPKEERCRSGACGLSPHSEQDATLAQQNGLRRSASQVSRLSNGSASADDLKQMANSTSALDGKAAGGKEAVAPSREPSPDADAKEKSARPPRFWRAQSSAARGFSLSSLSRAASPKAKDANVLVLGGGLDADASVSAKLLVEEIRTEQKVLKRFAVNLEAIALHMGKDYHIHL